MTGTMNTTHLEQYCGNHGIITATYQKAAELMSKLGLEKSIKENGGIATRVGKYDLIFLDGDMPQEEKYITFAHEIGHHVLEHTTTRKQQRAASELEADVFASVLMALSVFAELKAVTA